MPGKTLTFLVLLCAMLAIVSAQSSAPNGGTECRNARTCRPWAPTGPACRRNARFSLRFMADLAEENAWKTPQGVESRQAVYSFCPRVDELQAYTLKMAPFISSAFVVPATDDDPAEFHFTKTLTTNYLSVYGFGNSANRLQPDRNISLGAVVMSQNGSTVCGSPNSVAVVTTLVLNVGLNRGLFNYGGSSVATSRLVPNPDYNATKCAELTTSSSHQTDPARGMSYWIEHAVDASAGDESSSAAEINYCDVQIMQDVPANIVQPLSTGFEPTCTYDTKTESDVCIFDKENSDNGTIQCIGPEGQKNCARCYTSAEDLANADPLQVWTSYYGTDGARITLLSGGSNPIRFSRFAGANMLASMGDQLRGLFNFSNFSVSLPGFLT